MEVVVMRCLTLTQPWATLVAIGAKQIETRSWRTSHRGPLAIHAAAGVGSLGGKRGFQDLCDTEPFRSVLAIAGIQSAADLPLGCVLATCTLVSVVPTRQMTNGSSCWWDGPDGRRYAYTLSDQERAFGDYTAGRFAWLLADVVALSAPVPARGSLGLWEWQP
jgi:hypothetical protein